MEFHDPDKVRANRHIMERLVADFRARYEWIDVPCVVCGTPAEDTSFAFEKWGMDMRRCDGCGHLFVSPRLPEAAVPELYSSSYWTEYCQAIGSPTLAERLEFDHRNGFGKLHRDVLPFRSSGRLLDLGASNGGAVRAAVELGFEAYGLEPSSEICDLARRAHGVQMFAGSLAEQSFPDGWFDVVISHDVLEHMFEPVVELREVRRVLGPGGLLVIETPTTDSLNALDDGVDWAVYSPLEHVHLFSERNLSRVVAEAGFRIVDLYCPHEENAIVIGEAA
jgi:SAM-dependent methyltransferase